MENEKAGVADASGNSQFSIIHSPLPSGYKQTEVGVIPDDWVVSTVGAEFSVQLGKMLDTEKNVGTPKPFLGNRAVQWGRIDLTDIGEIRLTPYDLQRFRLREGDLLVCEGGEVGRAAIWRQPLEACYYQKALHRLRPIRGYNVQLMLNVLQRLASTGFLLNFVTQTSIAHLPKDKFETVPIPLPPTKAEQEAIAEALSDADALIESLEQLVAKKRQLKQAAMQELLTGKKRLPGFSGKWEVRVLGEIATANKGSQLSGSEITERGRFTYLNGGISPSGYTDKSNASGATIAISEGGNSCGYVQFMFEPYWCGGHCYSVIPNRIDNRFLYHALKGEEPSIMGLRVGSGLPNVQKTALLAFNLRCPKLSEEQTAIAEVLSDMDAEIATLEAKLAKARQLKQGMMQELLTGRIRLV